MPESDYLMNADEAAARIDRILAERFPDIYRNPEPASDSPEKIAADFPWLFDNANQKG